MENRRAAMQEAIDLAWKTTDPDVKKFQNEQFPNGEPSVDEFISAMKNLLLKGENKQERK